MSEPTLMKKKESCQTCAIPKPPKKIWRCLQCGETSCVKIQASDPVICHVQAAPQDADWRAEFTLDETFASQVVAAMVGREKRGPRATAFARTLGIPPETIKKYTSGQVQPGPWPQLALVLLAISDDAWPKLLGLKKPPKK